MEELRQIMERTHPTQIYLVCDAMTGQDAVNSAKEFNDRLQIDGVILTKLDGDARGGAALSVKFVTGKPIRFIGVGEQVDRLEEFHPERMADRILGMGDVRTLVEKAQEAVDAEQARRFQEKIRKQTLNLDDFLQQLQQVKKMGPLSDLLRLIPGMAKVDVDSAQEELPRIQGIIHAMTPQEREDPEVMDASRRRRIAAGSATTPAEVNQLLKQFRQMKKYLKHFGQAGGLAGAASMLGEASGSAPAAAGARGLRLRHGGRRKKHHRR
jgi:signal recognition particle subunit SRP54